MGITKKICLAAGSLALLAAAVAQTSRTVGQMERRRQELKLELLRERARIIREDPDAASLKARIERLQLELAQVVDAKPSIKRIRAELAAVEKVLVREKQK
jgi:hypothetical protein